MSEKTSSEIIADYERNKTQEKKIDSLNDNIEKLTGIIGKFLEMIPGSKDKDKDKDKSSIPVKIEDKKIEDKKESKKEEKNILSQFLGL